MWFSSGRKTHGYGVGPDDQALVVMLPDRCEWHIDDGRRTRVGTPPLITTSPSIKAARYHGYIVNGWLEACPDSEC